MWQLYRRLSLPFPVALDPMGQPCFVSGQLPAEFETQIKLEDHFAPILQASAIPIATAFEFVERPSIAVASERMVPFAKGKMDLNAREVAIALRNDTASARCNPSDEIETAVATLLGVHEEDLYNPLLDEYFQTRWGALG